MARYADYLSALYRPPLSKGRCADTLYLDKNEPPFSAFDSAAQLFSDADICRLRVYPDLYPLYQQLASFSSVETNNLLLTQGSEQALKNVFEVFVEPGDEVVYYQPSFAMYEVFCYQRQAIAKTLDFDADGQMDVAQMIAATTENTRLLCVINPHNFTGSSLENQQIERLVEHTAATDTLLLLDEAYRHYFDIDSVDFIRAYPHVIITRTFSKALGIPGARVGYLVAHSDTVELLRKVKPIDEIDYLAGTLAMKTLQQAEQILKRNVGQVRKWQQLFKEAQLVDIEYIDSNANYILLRSANYQHHKARLSDAKIVVKLDFDVPCLKHCIRFSVADDKSMESVFECFK